MGYTHLLVEKASSSDASADGAGRNWAAAAASAASAAAVGVGVAAAQVTATAMASIQTRQQIDQNTLQNRFLDRLALVATTKREDCVRAGCEAPLQLFLGLPEVG